MDFAAFERAAREANVIPISRVFAADTLTPVGTFLAFRRAGEKGFLFESVEGGRHVARYSILGVSPREGLVARDGKAFAVRDGTETALDVSFPEALRARLDAFRPAPAPDLPRFTGGYVGTLGYNCAAMTERLPVRPDPAGLPDAELHRFDDVVIHDHVAGLAIAVANALPEEHGSVRAAYGDAVERLERLEGMLAQVRAEPLSEAATVPPAATTTERAGYVAAVERAQTFIRDGDIFQVVLSIQETVPLPGDPFDVYRRLRMSNPSPYHFYLDAGEAAVLGASPEMLVRVEGGTVEIRPIAGTRPRGADAAEDDRLARELADDAKENAEHVMLVDLGRNDVGRVAEPDSVRVASFRRIERYSHVMHIVSSVTGRLRPDRHLVDALFACFPAGTVSGAPKIRAMEIIHDLEPVGRGVYSGAVGYFDYRGNLDTCIAIRTLVARGGEVRIQSGAGIVADSVPDREYEECLHKTAVLRAAVAAGGTS